MLKVPALLVNRGELKPGLLIAKPAPCPARAAFPSRVSQGCFLHSFLPVSQSEIPLTQFHRVSSYLGEKPHPLGSLQAAGAFPTSHKQSAGLCCGLRRYPRGGETRSHCPPRLGNVLASGGGGRGGGTGRRGGSEGNGSWGPCMPTWGGVSSLLGPTAWGLEGQLVSPSVCPRTPESPNKSWPGQKRLQRADSHESDAISQGAHPCSQLYLPSDVSQPWVFGYH